MNEFRPKKKPSLGCLDLKFKGAFIDWFNLITDNFFFLLHYKNSSYYHLKVIMIMIVKKIAIITIMRIAILEDYDDY